jgi:glycine oxidase
MSDRDVLVVGGGLIGFGIGWELARAGLRVTVVERDAAGAGRTGASWAAAGMLAPSAETGFQEEPQLALGRASLELYPTWVAEVEAASGIGADYRDEGSLIVAVDRDDAAWLDRVARTQAALGLRPQRIRGAEAREMEPHLSPTVNSAIFAATDHQIDNRLLWQSVRGAFIAAGGELLEGREATRLLVKGGRAAGVWVREEGEAGTECPLEADRTVICAGAWTRLLLAAEPAAPLVPPIRPVKGQILSLEMSELLTISHVIRARRVYMAPKSDGRLVVGATSEERGFDRSLTAGAMMDLLREAWETMPGVYDLAIREMWTGLRPASRDNAPVLGKTEMEGLFVATGHYRNGVLLTPITARAMRDLLVDGVESELVRPFRVERFQSRREMR